MKITRTSPAILSALLAAFACCSTCARAAVLSGSVLQTFTTVGIPGLGGASAGTLNLTNLGNLDWRQFADGQRKTGGGILSDYTASGTLVLYTNELFETTWTDGTPAPMGASTDGLLVTGFTPNPGFSFTAGASSTQLRRLTLLVGGYASECTLNVSLPGVPTYADSFSVLQQTQDYWSRIYQFDYQADSPSDVLAFSYTRNDGLNADLVAAAVFAVPELHSATLLATGVALLVGRRLLL